MSRNGLNHNIEHRRILERERFLKYLEESGNVRLACRGSGLSRSTAYYWRRDDPAFAQEWDEAAFRSDCPLLGADWKQAVEGQRKRTLAKYVYLIRDSWMNLVKIGVTKNISSRFRELQNGCPQELVIVGLIHNESANKIERQLHKRFASKNYRGEWFELTEADVDSILEQYG